MTHTKKIASMLMAVMLLCSLSVSALAIGEGAEYWRIPGAHNAGY